MKRLIQRLSLTAALLVSLLTVSAPMTAHAAIFDNAKNEACQGLTAGGSAANCDDPTINKGVSDLIRTAINLISIAVGIIAVIMVIIGGPKYITSQGDSNSINSAKNTLLYAIVGLVIALLAQVIVRFVLKRTTASPPASGTTTVLRVAKGLDTDQSFVV
jgi:hypothetical protein